MKGSLPLFHWIWRPAQADTEKRSFVAIAHLFAGPKSSHQRLLRTVCALIVSFFKISGDFPPTIPSLLFLPLIEPHTGAHCPFPRTLSVSEHCSVALPHPLPQPARLQVRKQNHPENLGVTVLSSGLQCTKLWGN